MRSLLIPSSGFYALALLGLWGCGDKKPDPITVCEPACGAGQRCQDGKCVAEGADLAMSEPPDMSPPGDMTRPPAGLQYVMDSLTLPKSATEYAIDIDGDGTADNKLGRILLLLRLANFDLQPEISLALKEGRVVQLLDLKPSPLVATPAATLLLQPGQAAAAAPKYDGTDVFTTGADPAVALGGALSDAAGGLQLKTKAPVDLGPTEAQRYTLRVPVSKNAVLRLDLYAAHVEAAATGGAPEARKLRGGLFHGVLRKQDLDTQLFPAIADVLTDTIHQNPDTPATKTIINLFEDPNKPFSANKCMTKPAECCAQNPKTCKIYPEEVKEQDLVKSSVTPDLHCFDAAGQWKPVPRSMDLNCLSVGLAFTAVGAAF